MKKHTLIIAKISLSMSVFVICVFHPRDKICKPNYVLHLRGIVNV